MKKRNLSIELLRIILMIMVVALHNLYYGILSPDQGARYILGNTSLNYYISYALESFIVYAVDCFILISGYYSIHFKVEKLMRLGIMMWFYSISLYILFVLLRIENFSIINLLKSNIPMFWWFMYYYLILMLASPFLNIMLERLNKKQYKLIIAGMGLIFCIVPTLTPYTFTNDRGFGIINFMLIYVLGSYFGKYDINIKKRWSVLGYLFCSVFIFCGNVFIMKFFKIYKGWGSHFFGYDNFFVIAGAVFLFMIFKSSKIKGRFFEKSIMIISPATLGVYLIHEHFLVRNYIYNSILHISNYFGTSFYILIVLLDVLIVFFVCTCIEILRFKLLGKFESKIIDFFMNKCHFKKFRHWWNKIFCENNEPRENNA